MNSNLVKTHAETAPKGVKATEMLRNDEGFSSSRSNVFTSVERKSCQQFGRKRIEHNGTEFYRITDVTSIPEFFLSLTSATDYWMFVSSWGALTAGYRDPDGALFPYYSSDKLSDLRPVTGPLTLIRIKDGNSEVLWQPFDSPERTPSSPQGPIQRNLYKTPMGHHLIFEEINFELGLSFEYSWRLSTRFGLVRSCKISNSGRLDRQIEILDGLQNILPPALGQMFQMRFSNLADAYKRSERLATGLGLFYLNSIPTDRAEPSEGLRANVVWQSGLTADRILLSNRQVSAFRSGQPIHDENDICGQRGCYLVGSKFVLAAAECKSWNMVADIDLDQTGVINLDQRLSSSENIIEAAKDDLIQSEMNLSAMIAAADGKQEGGEQMRCDRHQSNVLFNIMRGGIPSDGYTLDRSDFVKHLKTHNRAVFERNAAWLEALPSQFSLAELKTELTGRPDVDLLRLGKEYLPLTFSRRHGDPTRPWNFFSISTIEDDGSRKLDYQGNWRDIFQNWEALAFSYPAFAENMICRFLNSSTFDGYNPYRVTKDGFEWESPEPDDPWANIGYWGDHQIIYLLKLLESARNFLPGELDQWLNRPIFGYAQVPYRIDSFEEILLHPQQTIDFDFNLSTQIEGRVADCGNDGKLLRDQHGELLHVSLAEKLLVPALVKLTNFVPAGGIWLNTQRPEWNDANNALVGKGLSMVTVCYLRRYFAFLVEWFQSSSVDSISISEEVHYLLLNINSILRQNQPILPDNSLDESILSSTIVQLSQAGSAFRCSYYDNGVSGQRVSLAIDQCIEFLTRCQQTMEQTIRFNRRKDGLYHAYNLLDWKDVEGQSIPQFSIQTLYLMLEGQVAVLSSGMLSAQEAVELLDALRASELYRADQHSYLLYPDRKLPGFLEKNRIGGSQVGQSELMRQLLEDGEESLVCRDVHGNFHFRGTLRNTGELSSCLSRLAMNPRYASLVATESEMIHQIYEQVFDHSRYTGRSGTFFGYEGLGSIYWHMVSKLVLAISENIGSAQLNAAKTDLTARLIEHYRQVRDGLGLDKSPAEYGSFPTVPYSHTPRHAGAQQPGMTGQVKEDILSRFFELGVRIQAGVLSFDPVQIESCEFASQPQIFKYVDQRGEWVEFPLGEGEFGFTICQTPVIYHKSEKPWVAVSSKHETTTRQSNSLTAAESKSLFERNGLIARIEVGILVPENRTENHLLNKNKLRKTPILNLSGDVHGTV